MQIGSKVKVVSCPDCIPLTKRKLLIGYIYRIKNIEETTIETLITLSDPFEYSFTVEDLVEVE